MSEDAYWNEVRARSEETTASGMKVHCAVCWISFNYGAPAEDRPLPCPKHATPEERARADRMMASPEFAESLRSHPLIAMTKGHRFTFDTEVLPPSHGWKHAFTMHPVAVRKLVAEALFKAVMK